MSEPSDRQPILANQPPPYPTGPTMPGEATAPLPNEPPPKYEPPKTGLEGGYPGQPIPGGYQTCQPSVIMVTTTFGPTPQQMQCPYCQALITTSTDYQAGGLTWLAAGLLCLFGCWFGCCLIPFCVGDLQDVQHKCPNCSHVVGVYRRLD